MHRHIYTASFANIAVTAVQDLLALLAHSSSRIAICRIEANQFSDFGDAASEMLAYTLKRSTTTPTFGSGGTAPTVRNVKHWGRAAVTTARANDTTQAADGAPVTLVASAFHISAGLIYAPRFGSDDYIDERITVEAGHRFVVSLDSTAADSLSFSGTIWFEELGLTG